jgi:hypothetical protein
MDELLAKFDRDGFVVLPSVFAAAEVADMIRALDDAFAGANDSVLRSSQAIFGARNLLQLWPASRDVWRKPPLVDIVTHVLGSHAGLVRGLYFDKPPEQSWTLPFHRDTVIAVRDNRAPGPGFSHPTTKAGVPHVDAPDDVLERMLVLRIHLDPMTADNGPLSLIPGSHRERECSANAVAPLGPAGDVLAMRPLAAHGSRHTTPGTMVRRRIVHLEFAAMRELPGGMEWHEFIAVG